mmetsp:Transcript_16668/g.42991  ORF Transcript_16668/g.42991 Transcript_16668/m.42991 type:complete len:108 (+) Transcript_16668:534-857(+)
MYMLTGPHQEHCRLDEQALRRRERELREKGFVFANVFPVTTAAHEEDFWINFQPGCLQVSSVASVERGIAPSGGTLAVHHGEVQSPEELFERAENLWPIASGANNFK